MATSVYFSGAVKSEQDLYEDLVTESIKIFGQDVVYLPREQISEDDLLNETWNQYTQAYPIEMWLENAEGFEGDGNLLGKFGLEIRDQANFVVTKRRWDQVVGQNLTFAQGNQLVGKPAEGDLLYLTMTQRLFEIKYVEPKAPFYQLANLPSYTMTAELFEYNVIVTMYNPTRAQTDRTPNELADGTKINPRKASSYRFVALSRDLLKRWGGPFDYGDYIVIEGIGNNSGVYQVRDTMNSRFTQRVDILKSKGSNKFKYTNARMYSYTAVNENNLLAVD